MMLKNRLNLLLLSGLIICLSLLAGADKISKCHHEGDIHLNCNRTNMPTDTPEVIRSARLINGLYYNDSLCSFVPGTSCYREQNLAHCLEKATCTISNGWYSLEPHCDGHSYYSQVEYDCQPAYYMGERATVINNEFSGVIYSPNYPSSFRTDSNTPCYMTIHLPKNHHVQITLDHFNLLKTKSCVGDYLEIQEYVQTVRKLKRQSSYTNGDFHMYAESMDRKKRRKRESYKKTKFQWRTLGTMCGTVESKVSLRAMSDIVNIKFRPLPINHEYLKGVDPIKEFSFKIYFEAVPPEAPMNNELLNTQQPLIEQSTPKIITTQPMTGTIQDTTDVPLQTSYLLLIIGSTLVSFLIVLIIVIGLILIIKRCRGSQTQTKTIKPAQASKKPQPGFKKQESSDDSESLKLRQVAKPPANIHLGESTASVNVKPVAVGNKTKVVVEEEPRKMQTELPALLKDLGTSRLLLKYKAQIADIAEEKSEDKKEENNEDNIMKAEDELNVSKEKRNSRSPSNQSPSKLTGSQLAMLNTQSNCLESGIYDGSNQNIADISLKSELFPAKELLSSNTSKSDSRRSSKNSLLKTKNRKPSSTASIIPKCVEDSNPNNVSQETSSLLSLTNEIAKLEIVETDILKITHNKLIDDNKLTTDLANVTIVEDNNNNNNYTPGTKTNECPKTDKQTNLITFSLPSFPSRTGQANTAEPSNGPTKHPKTPNSIRKPAFNPLHVILKDKNKYYTTEYI